MSDYISIKDDRLWDVLFDEACVEGKQAERIQKELEIITVDEKEIIRKYGEQILNAFYGKHAEYRRLSEQANMELPQECYYNGHTKGFEEAIKIVREECGIE